MSFASRAIASLLFLAFTGCDPSPRPIDGGPRDDGGPGLDAASDATVVDASRDAFTSGAPAFVYANTRASLYRLDVDAQSVTRVGDFDCVALSSDVADSADGMTDLAMDGDGRMYGVGRGAPGATVHTLFTVDATSGHCVGVAEVSIAGRPTLVQGLSFVPPGALDPAREVLVGTDGTGAYFEIDPATGSATAIGRLVASSDTRGGDLVSITGAASWMITSANTLATFDLVTGESASELPIGGLGASDSAGWGLGFWGGRVYAFTYLGHLYAVDPTTAAAIEVPIVGAPADLSFRGAAVITSAPLI